MTCSNGFGGVKWEFPRGSRILKVIGLSLGYMCVFQASNVIFWGMNEILEPNLIGTGLFLSLNRFQVPKQYGEGCFPEIGLPSDLAKHIIFILATCKAIHIFLMSFFPARLRHVKYGWCNVDGRDPAPVDNTVNIPWLTGFYTSQVVQDFLHQQYLIYSRFLWSRPLWKWNPFIC